MAQRCQVCLAHGMAGLAIPGEDAIPASAKEGIGIEEILEAIVERVPPPSEAEDGLLRASVFDSVYDSFRGVVSYVRLISGSMKRGTRIKLFATEKTYEVKEVGHFTPKMTKEDTLEAGDVGYVIANMKAASEVKIGDTITDHVHPCPEALPGSTRKYLCVPPDAHGPELHWQGGSPSPPGRLGHEQS